MTDLVYLDIAVKVAGIVRTQGPDAAGEYLERIMEKEFEKIRKEIRDSKDEVIDAFTKLPRERLLHLAGIPSKDGCGWNRWI